MVRPGQRMADADVEIETSTFGALVRHLNVDRATSAAARQDAPTTQDERKTPARDDECHGECQRTETLAEQMLGPATTGELVTAKRSLPNFLVQISTPSDASNAHERYVRIVVGKPTNAADESS